MCKHTITARSARDERVWICLRCGANVSGGEQTVFEVLRDATPQRRANILEDLEDLPEPPERGVP